MRTAQLVLALGLLSAPLVGTHAAPAIPIGVTYRSAAAFDSVTNGGQLVEHFGGFSNGQLIPSLFAGRLVFPSPVPRAFTGFWGPMLLSLPAFANSPVVMTFDPPVFGVGANAFDDIDGSPAAARITFTAITVAGDTLVVSEDSNNTGDTGFLGATSCNGITRASFSIDGTGGNLEIDDLKIGIDFTPCIIPTRASTWGRIKSVYR